MVEENNKMYILENLPVFTAWYPRYYSPNKPEYEPASSMYAFQIWRNLKLCESDFMGVSDSATMSTDWATYRQALRDLPSNENYPANLTEPTFVPLDPNGE
tara:strand:+ start:30 stop:332 length:303 start_codon:yes stop_codon:yes gene_type:complete